MSLLLYHVLCAYSCLNSSICIYIYSYIYIYIDTHTHKYTNIIKYHQNSSNIFAQTLLVTQHIDATSSCGYGQPSPELKHLFHTDYMTLVTSCDMLHLLLFEFLSCKIWERTRFTWLSWLPHHRKTCWLQVICPNLHRFTGKKRWIRFPIFEKSGTERMTLVAISHLAIAWQSNLKRHSLTWRQPTINKYNSLFSWRCLRQRSLPIATLPAPK